MSKSFITVIEGIEKEDLKSGLYCQDSKVIIHKDWCWYFGRFDSMNQLEELSECMGFTYELNEEKFYDDNPNVSFKSFTCSHDFKDYSCGGFWDIRDVPADAKHIKALSNGSIVDCYYINDGQSIIMYRPNPNSKEFYKPINIKEHLKHVEVCGSY